MSDLLPTQISVQAHSRRANQPLSKGSTSEPGRIIFHKHRVGGFKLAGPWGGKPLK